MNAEKGEKATIYITKKKIVLLVLIVAAVLICGAFAAIHYFARGEKAPPALEADPNARIGTLSMSEAERIAALQQVVDEGMVNFSINATPYFKNATSAGNVMVENAAGSQNRFTVKIVLDKTGETIYESGLLYPDSYIETCRLTAQLDPGEYPCTAYFTTYALDEDRYIGQAGAKITVYVDGL